jgi:hypothetical protein
MNFDLRLPIGLMFTIIGALVAGCGVFNRADSVSLGININLIWGVVMLVFGVLMLIFALRGGKNDMK